MNSRFEQGCCIALYLAPLGGGLPCEFSLDFRSNIERNSHSVYSSSLAHPLPYRPPCSESRLPYLVIIYLAHLVFGEIQLAPFPITPPAKWRSFWGR